MDTHTLIRLVVGLGMTALVLVFAARRVLWLTNLIRSGQKTSDEHGRKDNLGTRITTQIKEVFGQTRLLKWSIPGLAHFFTMWGFFILASVYLEAYGLLFSPRLPHPVRRPLGRAGLPAGLLRRRRAARHHHLRRSSGCAREPKEHGRESRFYGSHTGGAWLILFMIFNVIWTYALVPRLGGEHRQPALRQGRVLLARHGRGAAPAGPHRQRVDRDRRAAAAHRRDAGLPADRAALQAPAHRPGAAQRHLQAAAQRAWARCCPVESKGEPIDFEDPAEDAVLGRGKIEDFTWKGYLDFTTCTECGRCQSQCPAWNTGKPLSPKLVIMNLRDHLFAKAPYILGDKETPLENTPEGGLGEELRGEKHDEEHARARSPASSASWAPAPSRPPARWSAPPNRAASSTPTCCGPAPPAAPASSSARWTSSTSTTSSTCAATR